MSINLENVAKALNASKRDDSIDYYPNELFRLDTHLYLVVWVSARGEDYALSRELLDYCRRWWEESIERDCTVVLVDRDEDVRAALDLAKMERVLLGAMEYPGKNGLGSYYWLDEKFKWRKARKAKGTFKARKKK